FGIIPS
ncbi:sodium/glutamate symporter, partial [Vibrio cholerae HC-55C2]